MAEAILIDAVPKVAPSLLGLAWPEIKSFKNYSSNIKELKEKLIDLESAEKTVIQQVQEAERDGQVIEHNVQRWMENVDKIKKKVHKVLDQDTETWCFLFVCPFILFSRYKLSNKSVKLATKLTTLQDNTVSFQRVGHPAPLGQMPFSSIKNFDGFKSRKRTRNGVMETLKDKSITTIGICGMPGVGKTTLVNEIADTVKTEKLFDEVVMAVVSKDPVIGNIQDQLAENLGLKIKEKSDHRRAERLYTRLMQKDKSILVILDDVWKELDLHDIGIPAKSDQGRLKVLLTSRFKMVCDTMSERTFEVELLSEKESWDLFKESAKISEEANDVKDIAQEVVKECGRLPLAIVTVGGALKKKQDYVWREVLQQLKEASMHSKVNSAIELSYNYLDKDSKLLFLLCSLFPEDYNIPVEDLIRYAHGMQWFKNVKTIGRVRDKVNLEMDELKSCFLLLAGTNEQHVKLHDVVRDVCLSIASSGEQIHTVRHDGLTEWSQDDICVSSTAISLTFHQIDKLYCGLEYPKLKLLRMSFKIDKLHIREDFFKSMKEVKVLELCNLNGELPPSLQSLVNLQTLCLHYCMLYGDMLVIGSQTKLEVLSFYGSYIEHFPVNISNLSNLKTLDLRFDFKNNVGPPLPSGILSRLRNLEDLYLGSHYYGWCHQKVEHSVFTTEISSLLKLQTIRVCAYDNHYLKQILENLHYENLLRFEVDCIMFDRGAENLLHYKRKGVGEYQFGKELTLDEVNVDLLKKAVTQYLLSRTEYLLLREIYGLTNLVGELDGKGFVTVKKLSLISGDLKCLVDATSFLVSGAGVFVKLEWLTIRDVKTLEVLYYGNLPVESFAKLRDVRLENLPALRHLWGVIHLSFLETLSIQQCDSLRSVFLKSSAKSLLQLQRIHIGYCQQLETVVSNGEDDDSADIEFRRLKTLSLSSLKSFKSFSPHSDPEILCQKVMLPNLEELWISHMKGIRCIEDSQMPIGSLSNLKKISVSWCDGLVHVTTSKSIRLLQSLEELSVTCTESVEVIFDFTSLNVEEEAESLEFPLARLESFNLFELFNLQSICRMLPKGCHAFKNLRTMRVGNCPLKYLLSPSMARMLVSLKSLNVNRCALMEAIIGVDDGEESTNKILFPKLTRLEVDQLDNLQMLCLTNVEFELPSLTKLSVDVCPKMTKFCAGQLIVPSHSNVDTHLPFKSQERVKVALDEFSSWLKDRESRIRCLDCSFLKERVCGHLN